MMQVGCESYQPSCTRRPTWCSARCVLIVSALCGYTDRQRPYTISETSRAATKQPLVGDSRRNTSEAGVPTRENISVASYLNALLHCSLANVEIFLVWLHSGETQFLPNFLRVTVGFWRSSGVPIPVRVDDVVGAVRSQAFFHHVQGVCVSCFVGQPRPKGYFLSRMSRLVYSAIRNKNWIDKIESQQKRTKKLRICGAL